MKRYIKSAIDHSLSSLTYLDLLQIADYTRDPVQIDMLMNNSDPQLRRNLARNKNIPESVREYLSHDTDDQVRVNIAIFSDNPEVLERLANDECFEVREYAAGNWSTPKDVVTRLLEDSNGLVRTKARKAIAERKDIGRW